MKTFSIKKRKTSGEILRTFCFMHCKKQVNG